MNKSDILTKIKALGLLAVLRGPTPERTLRMVDALVAGGILGIEVTYSTPEAAQVVKELSRKYGDEILLGMGTLTKAQHAAEAKEAGAAFLVSPHTDEVLAQAMTATGLACMFGALTPSEVVRAYHLGADVVKIFPGSLGGPRYMKALRGPLPHIPMMPTGGVSAENVADWFAAGAVAVGAGSALCPTQLAKDGQFEAITGRARIFNAAVQNAKS